MTLWSSFKAGNTLHHCKLTHTSLVPTRRNSEVKFLELAQQCNLAKFNKVCGKPAQKSTDTQMEMNNFYCCAI